MAFPGGSGLSWRTQSVVALACLGVAAAGAQLQAADVTVPCGTYSWSSLNIASGTASNPNRYVAATRGCVVVRGGAVMTGRSHVIIDGFVFDQRLHPSYPATQATTFVIDNSSNITVRNSEVIGPKDIHTGYDGADQVNCREFESMPTAESAGVQTTATTRDVTWSNVTIHGYHTAVNLRGTNDRIENSLIRNNFNIGDIHSVSVTMDGNVFWVSPNHSFEMHQFTGTFIFTNNLMVDSQDGLYSEADSASVFVAEHNTYWIPQNKPCYGMGGWNVVILGTSARMRNNVQVGKGEYVLATTSANLSKVSGDYNLVKMYERPVRWWVSGTYHLMAAWRSLTGQDTHSIEGTPIFVDPPSYNDFSQNRWGFRIPTSVAQARAWFALAANSPGKGAASDGLDMGITSTGVVVTTPPRAPNNVRIVR